MSDFSSDFSEWGVRLGVVSIAPPPRNWIARCMELCHNRSDLGQNYIEHAEWESAQESAPEVTINAGMQLGICLDPRQRLIKGRTKLQAETSAPFFIPIRAPQQYRLQPPGGGSTADSLTRPNSGAHLGPRGTLFGVLLHGIDAAVKFVLLFLGQINFFGRLGDTIPDGLDQPQPL